MLILLYCIIGKVTVPLDINITFFVFLLSFLNKIVCYPHVFEENVDFIVKCSSRF